MAEFDSVNSFVKVAAQRLADAEELMQRPALRPDSSDRDTRHTRGASYLAGYAAECLVKAYLIKSNRCQTLTEAQKRLNSRRQRQGLENTRNLSGVDGHSIVYLISLTDLEEQHGYDAEVWGRVAQWRSVWRYDARQLPRKDAEIFLESVRAVVNWLQPKI